MDKRNKTPSDITKMQIYQFCMEHGRRPSRSSRDPQERKLGKCMGHYMTQHDQYDPVFRARIEAITKSKLRPSERKDEIMRFIQENGRKPSLVSKNQVEYKIARNMVGYTSPSSRTFDPEFRKEIWSALKDEG